MRKARHVVSGGRGRTWRMAESGPCSEVESSCTEHTSLARVVGVANSSFALDASPPCSSARNCSPTADTAAGVSDAARR